MKSRLYFCTQTAAAALLIGMTGAAQAQSTDALETVVVTALKTATPLEKTAVAVTALDSKALAEQHIQNVQDIVHLVPSFQATTEGDHGVITMTLRGIGNDTAKTEYADPEVALFVDGIYTPRPEGATSLLFDLDNVQVMRGPQGTLWGRNSTTGVVNMVTAKPSLTKEISGDALIGGGNYSKVSVRAAVNIPLSDTFAVRVAVAHEQHDGYVDYQDPYKILPTVAQQEANYIASNDAQRASAQAAMTAGCPGTNCAALTTAYNTAVAQATAAHNGTGGMYGTFQPINMNSFITSGPKYSAQNQSALRTSFLWAPTEALTWNLSLEYFMDRGTPNMGLMETPRAGQKLWSVLADTAPALHRDVFSVRSRVEWDINDYLNFSYIAGASKFQGTSDFDQDAGVRIPHDWTNSDGMWAVVHQEDRTTMSHYLNWSHELQLRSSGTHAIDWLMGLYYGGEQNGMKFDIPDENGTFEAVNPGWQGTYYQFDERVLTEAAFGQATWNVTDALHITGGLRFSHDVRKNVGGRGYSWNGNCNQFVTVNGVVVPNPNQAIVQSPEFGPTYDVTNPANSMCWGYGANDATFKGDKLTWLGRVQYDVTDQMIVYASAATGYKSGGTQDNGGLYKPETLTNYEIGTKNILFNGAVTWNNAIYYMEFRGYQVQQALTIFNPDGSVNSHILGFWNADSLSRAEGFETELAARLSPDDTLNIVAAIQGTRLGHALVGSNDYGDLQPSPGYLSGAACGVGVNNCVNILGHSMAHAPAISGTVGYSHDFHLAGGAILEPRVNFHFESNSWISMFHENYNGGRQDLQTGYTRTDLALRYTAGSGKWYLEGWMQNVENANIKTGSGGNTGANSNSGNVDVFTSQYLPPRTFGINLGVNF